MRKTIIYIDTSKPVNKNVGGSIYSMLNMVLTAKSLRVKPVIILGYHLDFVASFCAKHQIEYDFLFKVKLGKSKSSSWKKYIPFKSTLALFKKDKMYPILLEKCRQYHPDVIHANNRLCSNLQCLKVAKTLQVPYYQHQRMFDKFGMYHRNQAKYVTKFIAISQAIKDNVEFNGIDSKKVELIHNWKISDDYHLPETIEKHSNKLIWIGRIEHWKGLHIAIEILKELRLKKSVFTLDVFGHFGNAEYKAYCQSLIDEYELKDFIQFKGYVQYKDIHHDQYLAFIHTSVKPEPFGRTLIESMKYGIPVCATNMGGVTDIVEHQVSGYMYDPDQLDDLIEHLLELEAVHQSRSRMIKKGKERFEEKFSGKKQQKQLEHLYEA